MSRNALVLAALLPLAGLAPFALQGRAVQEKDTAKDTAQAAARKVPTLGKKAPRFKLNDHEGKIVRVGGRSRSKSWTVIAFYPKAGTPG